MPVATAKRVGGQRGPVPKTDVEKAEKGKKPYDAATYVDANGEGIVNSDGLMTALPVPYGDVDGFNPDKHKPLVKGRFVDEALFLDYRAYLLMFRAAKQMALAEKLTHRAVTLRKFGDPIKRAKFVRLQKMRDQMAALELELGDDANAD